MPRADGSGDRDETAVEAVPRLALSIDEASQALGIGDRQMRELAAREDFPAFRLGRRVLVPVDELRTWLRQQAAEELTEKRAIAERWRRVRRFSRPRSAAQAS